MGYNLRYEDIKIGSERTRKSWAIIRIFFRYDLR